MTSFKEKLNHQLDEMIIYRRNLRYQETTTSSTLRPFLDYCGEHFPKGTAVTEEMVSSWLAYRRYNSPNTANAFLSCLRHYSAFIRLNGEEAFFPGDEYNQTYIQFIPTLLNEEEIGSLFYTIDTSCTRRKCDPPTEIISPVLYRFMLICGLRPAEPLHLLKDDVNLETGDVYIRKSKNHKDRHIIVSEDMRNLCRAYDSLQCPERVYFFEHNNKALLRSWMTNHFRTLAMKSNLGDKAETIRPYDLRHMFASRTIMKWIDDSQDVMALLPYLSVYMGHTDIEATLYYVHLLPERLKKSAGIDWSVFSSVYGGTYEG